MAVVLGALWGAAPAARPQPEPFQAMRALPAEPPVVAPAVTFQDLDGRPVGLGSFRGRPVLLTFFTTW
jgi:cytochrome oxidase Cu insertion factor (SCO1/SenC/PrrC family)